MDASGRECDTGGQNSLAYHEEPLVQESDLANELAEAGMSYAEHREQESLKIGGGSMSSSRHDASVTDPAPPIARLLVYELQPRDLGCERLKASSRKGILVSDALEIEGVGEEFESFETNGDGGCALHATWGHPSTSQQLAVPDGQVAGRQQFCSMLGDTQHDALQLLGDWEVFEQMCLSIWNELAVPAANRYLSESDCSREALMFWEAVCKNSPSYAEHILHFLEQRKADEAGIVRSRVRYRKACNAVFSLDHEQDIIRPLARDLLSTEFPVDDTPGSRYMSLFHGPRR